VQKEFETFDVAGAYAAAVLLALIALATLFAMSRLNRRQEEN
jgi:ABC-type sulfate transport system permease subunit